MKIAEYTKTPLTWSKRTHFNLILQEDTNYCEYITETPNNLLFLYGEQVAFVDKDILKQRILHKKEELKAIEASFIWLYAHAPSEEHRKKLIDQFVNKHGKKL
jgi:hypothetical protein